MGVLDGEVALITGAGQGVGRGIALALAAEGAVVAVAGRTVSKCEAVVAEIEDNGGRGVALALDVKDAAQIADVVERVADELGGLSILVNNAQEVARGSLLEVDEQAVQAGWESGPLATLRLMRAAHPHLRGGGVIVNLGSRAGVKADPVGCGAYGAVKEAIRVLTRSAAWEWADDGIRAYAIMPLADSPALADLARNEPDAHARSLAAIPQRRFGDPETDIGRVVVFLCGPDAGYLTGITIPIDGGAAHLG
ncbi:MAG: SDR family NAD(P)-dependent oxidoreductase [Acidimicrobiales bacterium]